MNCPKCHAELWGVEYCLTPCDYDGVSEWKCMDCGYRVGRWSGKELHDGELEGRYGRDTPVLWRRTEPAS